MPATAAGRVTSDGVFTGGLPACRGSTAYNFRGKGTAAAFNPRRRPPTSPRPRALAPGLQRRQARLEFLELRARTGQHVGLRVELLARDELEPRELLREQRLDVLLQVGRGSRIDQGRQALLQIVEEG